MKSLIMFASAALSLAAIAQPPMRGPMAGASLEPVIRFIQSGKAEELGISAEQIAKIKALADNRMETRELHEKVRKGMDKQAELMQAEPLDEAAVTAAFDEVWNARKEIGKLQMKRLIAIRGILTSEQIAKIREAMRGRRGMHGKNGKGHGRGPKAKKAAEPVE